MALELFKPFVIAELIKMELAHNVRSANKFIESGRTEIYDILENLTKHVHVLLNRAPTLHRLGIQAFQPVLIEGKAIQLHPFVCAAFNADFDGDQMAVHVPLTEEAKKEAAEIMLSAKNLLRPGDGTPITLPQQDFILGVYYMTFAEKDDTAIKKYFATPQEAIMAYEQGVIQLQDLIKVNLTKVAVKNWKYKTEDKFLITTVGRILFNEILPDKLKFINKTLTKKEVKEMVFSSFEIYGIEETAFLLDSLKEVSVKYLTKSGISWAMGDLPDIPEKKNVVLEAEKLIDQVQDQYENGLLTNDERRSKVLKIWFDVNDKVLKICQQELLKIKNNSVNTIMTSGARGSWGQTSQMMGMKGLVSNPSGETIELPVKASFKEGFDVLEYFISTHGARKGLSDTALRTAEAGYLTRKLIDVSQSIIISEDDCGDEEGLLLTKKESMEMGEELARRVLGRVVAEDIKDPATKKIIIKKGQLVDYELSRKIAQLDLDEIRVRSVLTCKTNRGLCAKCYGWDLGYNQLVKKGATVGIIAAQSIGEPGTQLTMRTFHTGGVAAGGDITQGLPRVQEVFEARPVKKPALISPLDGAVTIEDNLEKKQKIIKIKGWETQVAEIIISSKEVDELQVKDGKKIKKDEIILETKERTEKASLSGIVKVHQLSKDQWQVTISSKREVEKEMVVTSGVILWVKNNDLVIRGQQLTEGALDLQELFLLRGKIDTQKYVLKEIQHIYSSQGQKLNDKHIEIIARQMFSRIIIEEPGDSDFSPGEVVEVSEFNEANEKLAQEKKEMARGNNILLGITKASLSTSSFLSAASFQETARILIDAAVSGKIDYLRGLKENVIIGRLVPAGTGYKNE